MTAAIPEPTPDDVENVLAGLQQDLVAHAPITVPASADEQLGAEQVEDTADEDVPGETRRVRKLQREVDEAHLLLALQGEQAPLLVDTQRVRRRQRKAFEAARLHALAQDVQARAYQAARMRRWLTTIALIALIGALGWSTTGVHETLTLHMAKHDAAWWGAWAVEPVISWVLLVVVAARAYIATRGATLDHPHLRIVEYGALVVTMTLNVWPYRPMQPGRVFDPMQMLAHAIGPLVAVGVVVVLPIIWAAFSALDHRSVGAHDRSPQPPTKPSRRVRERLDDIARGLVEGAHRYTVPATTGPAHDTAHHGPAQAAHEPPANTPGEGVHEHPESTPPTNPVTAAQPAHEPPTNTSPEPPTKPAHGRGLSVVPSRPRTARKPARKVPTNGTRKVPTNTGRKSAEDYLADAREHARKHLPAGTEVTPVWVREVTGCSRGTSSKVATELNKERAADAA
jgi:hypothetical protein